MVQLTFQRTLSNNKNIFLQQGKIIIVVSENGIDAGGAGVELKNIGVEKVMLLKWSYFMEQKKPSW